MLFDSRDGHEGQTDVHELTNHQDEHQGTKFWYLSRSSMIANITCFLRLYDDDRPQSSLVTPPRAPPPTLFSTLTSRSLHIQQCCRNSVAIPWELLLSPSPVAFHFPRAHASVFFEPFLLCFRLSRCCSSSVFLLRLRGAHTAPIRVVGCIAMQIIRRGQHEVMPNYKLFDVIFGTYDVPNSPAQVVQQRTKQYRVRTARQLGDRKPKLRRKVTNFTIRQYHLGRWMEYSGSRVEHCN
ncbi:hypothetical protein EV401DRAFT_1141514 [Pisolithus croceorrhizus]|nr:hypothetical protein EV401DRAFT_1141514 [Pisolithus croceorrhizus]